MKEFMTKMVPVNLSDRFPFKCRMCGACCRHVRESVPLESLDAFRLAKHLRDKGENVSCVEDVLATCLWPSTSLILSCHTCPSVSITLARVPRHCQQ